MTRQRDNSESANRSALETSFAALTAVSDDALLIVDKACNVVLSNALAVELLGARIHQYPLNNFIRHPDFFRSVQECVTDARMGELVYARPDNVKRSFRIRCAPFMDDYVLVSLVDLTKAQSIEKIQTDFVANVSHELRSPLTAITGFIETLLGGAADDADTRIRFLQIMDEEAGRMRRLVDGLLSLSRIEAEEHLLPRGRVNLMSCLSNAVDAQGARAAARDMTIKIDRSALPEDMSAHEIRGDQDSIEQVFHNLIENAIKYGYGGTEIKVQVYLSGVNDGASLGHFIHVSFQNQGDGIEASHIPRLTERFYRVDNSRSRQLGGTGLGLAIVKHIVNWHQGRLSIESELKGTTRFSVSFPCVRNSQ